jgi:hypothetical protein
VIFIRYHFRSRKDRLWLGNPNTISIIGKDIPVKVDAHLPSSDGSDFIITYIVSNEPVLTCPHRTYRSSAMPTVIPERGILSDWDVWSR